MIINTTSESGLASITETEPGRFELIKKQGFDKLGRDKSTNDRRSREISYLACDLYDALVQRHVLGRFQGADDDLCDMFQEPISNAEEHGNEYNPAKRTRIRYSLSEEQGHATFVVEVEDEGSGFNHAHLREAEINARNTLLGCNGFKTVSKADSCGHGLFTVLRYADLVSWNERGNIIRTSKRLTPK